MPPTSGGAIVIGRPPTQLVGALGAFLTARPDGASQETLDIAAQLVLDLDLLGVAIDDLDAPQLAKLAPREAVVVGHVRGWIRAEERRRSVDVEPVSPRRSAFSDQTGAAESAASAVEERPRPTTDRHADLGRRFVRPVERPVGGEAPHDEEPNRVARARPLPARSRVDQPAPGEAAPIETSPAESSPPPVPTVAIASSTETPSSGHIPMAVATPVEGETKVAQSERVWRRYEEWFWWAVCLLAVAAILWRVLA